MLRMYNVVHHKNAKTDIFQKEMIHENLPNNDNDAIDGDELLSTTSRAKVTGPTGTVTHHMNISQTDHEYDHYVVGVTILGRDLSI